MDALLPDNSVVPVFADPRVQWPDSMSVPVLGDLGSAHGASHPYLYVTASRVNTLPFIKDAAERKLPFALYRVALKDDMRCVRSN